MEKYHDKSTTYGFRRYVDPSSLLASQTTKSSAKARKKSLTTKPLTYEDLLQNQQQQLQRGELKRQTAANRASALRLFLNANHIPEQDVVGAEMRVGFSAALEKLGDHMRKHERSPRAVSNTLSMVRRFREMVVASDRLRAISTDAPAPFMQALRSILENHPVKRVARQAAVPHDMLFGWLKGKVPRPSSGRYIRRIESFFGLERDSLTVLAGLRGDMRPSPRVGEAPENSYRTRLKAIHNQRFLLVVPQDSPLRQQWTHLLQYKTSPAPAMKRSSNSRWTKAPLAVRWPTPDTWYLFLSGVEVPSAQPTWNKIASYLGWMALPKMAGGCEKPPEQLQSLAWLAIPELIEPYIEWRKERTGGIHSRAILTFLGVVMWMTRPADGYLTQQPQLQATLPEEHRSEPWEALCARQFDYCMRLKQAYVDEVRPSRDPFQPLRPILDLPQPMDAIADMVQRLRMDRPQGGPPWREAIWSRNLVLLKLLASNPLRRRNLAALKWTARNRDGYHPDNDCSLYQRSDGSWWIFVPKHLLKNRRGGEAIRDYDSPVHQTVWPDLERYLFRHRSTLMSGPTDYVLLSWQRGGKAEHKPYMFLSHTVKALTKRYLWRSDGIGSHAFRHIVATSILKTPLGTTKTAALVLNDRERTVEAHYSGLQSGDGATRMGELLADSFRRM